MTMNTDNPASVSAEALQQILDAFNRHDLDAIMAFFAADAVFEAPRGPDAWGRKFVGKDRVREGLAARFTGIPDVHYGDDTHWACGNRGVSEWTLTGTTTDGVRLNVRGCDLWEFRDGAIVRKDPSGRSWSPSSLSERNRPTLFPAVLAPSVGQNIYYSP